MISAIPKHLLSIAKQTDGFNKPFFTSIDNVFPLSETVQVNLSKVKSRDFYKLLNAKTHNEDHTGPLRWSQNLSINSDTWGKIFKSLKNICKDTKLKEFQFKLIHRIIVTNKELFRFGIASLTTNVCIVEIKTPSNIHSSNVRSLRPSWKRSFNGLTKQTYVRSSPPPRKSCLASFPVHVMHE